MGRPNIKKGDTLYANFLKKLTPEEYAEHMRMRTENKRKLKEQRSMKEAMKAAILENQAQWIATLNNAAVALIKNAIDNGDVPAFTAVYDRLVGKPDTAMDITSNGQTVKAPVIIFESAELPEWNDDRNE